LHSRRVGNFVLEESREATRSMFSDNPPDAVFVANDHMALAVMDTIRYELGLKIPDDVSIIGYDDVPAASWPSYLLTTVQQPVNIMVRETVEILIEKIDNAHARPQKIKIDGPLILRNSTKTQKGYK